MKPSVLMVEDEAYLAMALEDLLTDASRKEWLRWREQMSDIDDWGPPRRGVVPAYEAPKSPEARVDPRLDPRSWPEKRWGTINCLALDEAGDLSGITTTSGLAFKIPGRVGDSPLIGCGLYVDNAVGAAGSTGVGEECIKIVGAHTVVEMMRRGMSPADACLEALKRVASNYNQNMSKLRQFNLNFYALNKNGEHGAAALFGYSTRNNGERRRNKYAVHDGRENKLHDVAYLYESPDK